jgi:uncharacterized protein
MQGIMSLQPADASLGASEDRIASIDAIRGIALFGVLIVNLLTIFSISIFGPYPDTPVLGADWLVQHLVALVLEGKAITLFSLLFGVGLAMQYERLLPSRRPHYWLARRLAALLAFGLAHLLLVWNGDILTAYALAGFLVLPLLALAPRVLLAAAAALLALQLIGPLFLYSIPWGDEVWVQEHVDRANAVYAEGSYLEVRLFSLWELPPIFWLHVSNFPRTLALFVFGAWLWNIGVLQRPDAFRPQLTAAAWAGIVSGTALMAADAPLNELSPVLMALGYGAALLLILPRAPFLRSAFAPLGRMAFTNYLLQSIVFGFIFYGYGLGQFGKMGSADAFTLGVGVYLFQIALSKWWLGKFRFGPVEWLWRTLMYGFAAPLRKA